VTGQWFDAPSTASAATAAAAADPTSAVISNTSPNAEESLGRGGRGTYRYQQ
jgi:aminopeptidase N